MYMYLVSIITFIILLAMLWLPLILEGQSWSYGSWIYNYLCNQCLSSLELWVRISLNFKMWIHAPIPISSHKVSRQLPYAKVFIGRSVAPIYPSWSIKILRHLPYTRGFISAYFSPPIIMGCDQCLSSLELWVRISLRLGVSDITSCYKVCQWLAAGQWFSPVSSTIYCS
jgi:hypothetical protein